MSRNACFGWMLVVPTERRLVTIVGHLSQQEILPHQRRYFAFKHRTREAPLLWFTVIGAQGLGKQQAEIECGVGFVFDQVNYLSDHSSSSIRVEDLTSGPLFYCLVCQFLSCHVLIILKKPSLCFKLLINDSNGWSQPVGEETNHLNRQHSEVGHSMGSQWVVFGVLHQTRWLDSYNIYIQKTTAYETCMPLRTRTTALPC